MLDQPPDTASVSAPLILNNKIGNGIRAAVLLRRRVVSWTHRGRVLSAVGLYQIIRRPRHQFPLRFSQIIGNGIRRLPRCGAAWLSGLGAGVFYLNLYVYRSHAGHDVGFRSALPLN